MNSVASVMDRLTAAAEKANPQCEGDYINPEDGLLYCGKCGTPKQCRIFNPLTKAEEVKPVPCKCRTEELEKEQADKRRRDRESYIEFLRLDCDIPGKYARCTFDGWQVTEDNRKILDACEKYADNFDEMCANNWGMLFYGDTGTGKTFAAACIANALIEQGNTVYMKSLAELMGSNNGFGINEETVARLNRAKLLIIDDFGAERRTDYALEKVFEVIDGRYRAHKPMIITTNLDFAEIKNVESTDLKRIYQRVSEACCYPVKFSGESFRKSSARNRFEEMKKFFEGDSE